MNWRNYANAEFLLCISDIDVDFKHQAVKQPTRVQYYSIYYNVRLCMYVLYLYIVLSCVYKVIRLKSFSQKKDLTDLA